jgi:hypothetical protein
MVRNVKQIALAFAAVVMMSAPAMAATLIDFKDGDAGVGGTITFDGTDLFGVGLPIGKVTISGAPLHNGNFDVDGNVLLDPGEGDSGADGVYGSLDFNTATNTVSLTGCIPGLGIGIDANGVCTPVELLGGTITDFDVTNSPGGPSNITFSGFYVKNPQLLTVLGLPPTTPFFLDTFALLTGTLVAGGDGVQSISTDVRNVAVPEPATMMLLGTGLLAAFRARRQQA